MRRWILIIIVVVVIAVLVTGYIGLTQNKQSTSNSAEAARDAVITYFKDNHPETVNFTSNLVWSGGKQEIGLVGAEAYLYTTSEWTMNISCSVVSNPLYNIDANYTKDNVTLEWMGTYQNGTVTEEGYITYNIEVVLPPQLEALYSVTGFIEEKHAETADFFKVTSWSGGLVPNPEGFVGSETYKYLGIGWNVTVQYPVEPNAIYSVNATYAAPHDASGRIIVDWQGTWQNGTVTETHYAYKP